MIKIKRIREKDEVFESGIDAMYREENKIILYK